MEFTYGRSQQSPPQFLSDVRTSGEFRTSAATAVPEPSSNTLALLGLAVALPWERKKLRR